MVYFINVIALEKQIGTMEMLHTERYESFFPVYGSTVEAEWKVETFPVHHS